MQRARGALVQILVKDLKPSIAYEFRYAARNRSGLSEFSMISQRALTTKAIIPGEARVPSVTEVLTSISAMVVFVEAHLTVTTNKKTVVISTGIAKDPNKKKKGHPVQFVHIEAKECTMNIVRPIPRYNVSHDNKYLIPGLTPGVIYQFRCKLENDIGFGPPSQWSKEVRMPAR
mgnify:CR=1 FL=1